MTALPDDALASISTVLLPFSTESQPSKNTPIKTNSCGFSLSAIEELFGLVIIDKKAVRKKERPVDQK